MIEFENPQLSTTVTQLPQLMKDASACIAFMISLGKRFVDKGIADIDKKILPKLKKLLPEGVWPRVVHGYATLMWFTEQVHIPSVHVCLWIVHL